jgi:hypothetical protein
MFYLSIHNFILEKEFNEFIKSEINIIKQQYSCYKSDKNSKLACNYAKMFPFLKSKQALPSFDEIILWSNTVKRFDSETKLKPLIARFISKITGLYKHGQTEKTGLCNLRILANMRSNKLSIAISKNTLSAKEQWEGRLIKDLKKEHPSISLKDSILVISSKKNDLNGNATHCKDIHTAFSHYSRGNFKIIFICSNTTRINDILKFLEGYRNLSNDKQIPIDIQHDEAHNNEEGIPSKRELIEHIIINPFVESYVPVTASYDPIIKDTSHLWKKKNLDTYSIDYTKHSQTLSTSENYSSISDANTLLFEDIVNDHSYTDHNIREFDEATFDEGDNKDYSSWIDQAKIKADKDRRRKLEYHQFMAEEQYACNLGMNILDNKRVTYKEEDGTIIETDLILANQRNIHIITTPLRVPLTIYLMKYAITKAYNPICIGLYRGEIHLKYKTNIGDIISKKYADLSEEYSSEEVNNKINDIIEYLKNLGESIHRPIFIMGNYKPTGESITFVNYKYGTIRSDTLLPISGLSREMSYQGFLRSAYMDIKFKENSPDGTFKHPPKWILGSKKSIDDALNYEKENDERILRLQENSIVPLVKEPIITMTVVNDDKTNISVPMKIMIEDIDDKLHIRIRDILKKRNRNEEDKKNILDSLKMMITKQSASIVDPTGKFNFDKFILKDIRCYKKYTDKEIDERIKTRGIPFEADWRFSSYDSYHKLKSSYLNNKETINVNECELLVAFDKYEYEGFVNNKTCIWMSYRF